MQILPMTLAKYDSFVVTFNQLLFADASHQSAQIDPLTPILLLIYDYGGGMNDQY